MEVAKTSTSREMVRRLGNTNLNALFAYVNYLIEHPNAIENIPDGSTVVFQNTGDEWVDQKNLEIAQLLEKNGRQVFLLKGIEP